MICRAFSRVVTCVLLACAWVTYLGTASAQERRVATQQQSWVGYMTQARFSDNYSWWNDAHFVPGAFYILRTGLTYHFAREWSATAGYAYLGLPLGSVTRDLKRREHRPWGQIVHNPRFGDGWSLLNRFRYDARLRRNVEGGQIAPGYSLTNRGRFNVTLRREFAGLEFGAQMVPYVSVGNEVLLDFGLEGVRLDQNRVLAGIGVARRRIAVQASYMNRLVQLASVSPSGTEFIMNHTLVLWVFHNFDLRPETN